MAKKVKSEESGMGLPSVLNLIQKVDKTAEVISECATSNINDWIPTGSYALNACMSGDIFKAIPSGRVTTLAGTSGSGKSFLACSCCREAQKKGYTPVYMDSEGAIDDAFVRRLGVKTDPECGNALIVKQVSTIGEVSQFMRNILAELEAQDEKYGTHNKIMFVLDSLGNLSSDKEISDTMDGNNKRDMTKAQEIKALFRVNATALAKMQVPFIVVNHVYAQVGAYVPTNVQSGGSGILYNSSVTIELSAAKLEDKMNEKAAGDHKGSENMTKLGVFVTAKPIKSRFCRPIKVKFQIPYFSAPNKYVGLENFMTWDNSGVVRGNEISEKDYLKMTEAAKAKVLTYEQDGVMHYVEAKDTARGIFCKHLGRQVSIQEFFTDTVFTPDFLEKLNTTVIRPMFELPDQSSMEDIKEIENIINPGESVEEED